MLICMLKRLPRVLKDLDARLYHNIHDELILESSKSCADKTSRQLKQAMIEGFLKVFPEASDMVTDLVDVQTGDRKQ